MAFIYFFLTGNLNFIFLKASKYLCTFNLSSFHYSLLTPSFFVKYSSNFNYQFNILDKFDNWKEINWRSILKYKGKKGGEGACIYIPYCSLMVILTFLGSTTCDTCPEGKKCENATSTPTDCLAGYVAAAGSSTCTLCANSMYKKLITVYLFIFVCVNFCELRKCCVFIEY